MWLAQWYSAKLRNQALADAEQALNESREFGQRAARNQDQLGGIVDEVRNTASDLLQMAGQLQQTGELQLRVHRGLNSWIFGTERCGPWPGLCRSGVCSASPW